MARIRCYVSGFGLPGDLYLVTLRLRENCAPIRESCMAAALDRWQRLFTVRILTHALCGMGATMLAYVPGKPLGDGEAAARNAEFDRWLLAGEAGDRRGGRRRRGARAHSLSARQLGSLSDFMRLFAPDLRRRHFAEAPPPGLPPGYSRHPAYRCRYGAVAVQHDALPPVFGAGQLQAVGRQLEELGFAGGAGTCGEGELHMSAHGLGTRDFLAELEERCQVHLESLGRAPTLWQSYGHKYIAPVDWDVMRRRIGSLAVRETYEEYPRVWSLLQGLDSLSDRLMHPETIAMDTPMPRSHRDALALQCLPLTVTLLLTDGLLRWHYRTRKGVTFPQYNYYRRLRPWEERWRSG